MLLIGIHVGQRVFCLQSVNKLGDPNIEILQIVALQRVLILSIALAAAAAWPVYALAPQAAGAGVAEVMAYLNGCVVPKVSEKSAEGRRQEGEGVSKN